MKDILEQATAIVQNASCLTSLEDVMIEAQVEMEEHIEWVAEQAEDLAMRKLQLLKIYDEWK